jgi:hypothetical protein
MKISRNTLAWLGLLGMAFMSYPAMAQPKLQAPSELTGIDNVLNVIRNVDPRQADPRSNRLILDIMDAKGEFDGQNNPLSGTKSSVVSQGQLLMKKATPPQPPAHHLKAF